MRTTLNIDDDILSAARARAKHESRSVGAVISELARASLSRRSVFEMKNGVPLLPVSNPQAVVTTEMVLKLIDKTDLEDVREASFLASGRAGPARGRSKRPARRLGKSC